MVLVILYVLNVFVINNINKIILSLLTFIILYAKI
jgi:hypothetical protein